METNSTPTPEPGTNEPEVDVELERRVFKLKSESIKTLFFGGFIFIAAWIVNAISESHLLYCNSLEGKMEILNTGQIPASCELAAYSAGTTDFIWWLGLVSLVVGVVTLIFAREVAKLLKWSDLPESD
jgi:hypothetical protein